MLVPDFAIFAGDPGKHKRLAVFFKFAAPSDSTPQKRAAPAALAQASGSGPRGSKFSVSLI